jgi:ribosome maturation protein SDO1
MRIKVSLPVADAKLLREKVLEGAEKVEHDETTQEDWEAVCLHKIFCSSRLNNFW